MKTIGISKERGSALVISVVLSAVMLLIAVGSVYVTGNQRRMAGRSLAYKQAIALAEAGADRAIASLNSADWSGWSLSGANRVLLNSALADESGNTLGKYSVTIYNAATATPRIDAVGEATFSNVGTVKRRIVVPAKGNTIPSYFGPYGVYSSGNIGIDSKASTDGYDSSVGPYGVNGNSGLIHSVAAVGYAQLSSNSSVGNLQAGGNINIDNGNAKYKEISPYNMPTAPPPFPDSDLAKAKTTNDNSRISVSVIDKKGVETLLKAGVPTNGVFNFNGLNANGTMKIVFPEGTYYLNSIELNSNADLVMQGPVKIYMDPGANNVAIQMNSNTTINATGANPTPANCQFFIKSGTVNLNSNFSMYAGMFAPNSPIRNFNSNTYLYGALVAGDIQMNSNSHIYVDKSMTTPGVGSGFMAQSWTEMPTA